ENLHAYSTCDIKVLVEIFDCDDSVLRLEKNVVLCSGINYIDFNGVIRDAKLWWPNGMGEPFLYDVKVSVDSGSKVTSYPGFKFGLRTLKINQDKLSWDEKLFAIEINGVRTFCKGANWIPADSVYARVTEQKYDILLEEAKEANFNMLRIWGGGIYERDVFYEKCDEYGIMIWQDFMFACSAVPDSLEWFRDEVKKEMDFQTRKLRNHPSLVLWCGNNENYQSADSWFREGDKYRYFGGSICYNLIAPTVVRHNCPEIPYWNGSPYGGEFALSDKMGDKHHWGECTMNPDMEKRITPEEYDSVTAKFVSEYGYIGPCCKSTIEKYHAGMPVDIDGRIWKLHNNTFEKDTVAAGVEKHYIDPLGIDLNTYILYAGLCQGLMYGYSLEALRF
ncbi:MAG: beta-mannosidase, partial [Clostridiales bacterium]|nr:beta-mannosidase [Clostridiales bacterium]